MAARILIVEDNEDNLQLASKFLEMAGYETLHARSGEEGIAVAIKSVPDLILMDINLKGMDGLTAAAIIKKDPALKTVPIIALTARAMVGDMEMAIARGCDGYLTKPVNFRTFPSVIAGYLGETDDGKKENPDS